MYFSRAPIRSPGFRGADCTREALAAAKKVFDTHLALQAYPGKRKL